MSYDRYKTRSPDDVADRVGRYDGEPEKVCITEDVVASFWSKPGPLRQYDWLATYSNYDGADDSPTRGEIGYGRTEADAVRNLLDNFPRADKRP